MLLTNLFMLLLDLLLLKLQLLVQQFEFMLKLQAFFLLYSLGHAVDAIDVEGLSLLDKLFLLFFGR